MKVLITGGYGVLGRLLYHHLRNEYDIYLLDRSQNQSERIIIDKATNDWQNPNIDDEHYYECDILDYEKLRKAVQGKDIVVHLAALLENQNPERITNVNVQGTKNVLDACREARVKKFIYASSCMVMYSHRENPIINSIFTGTIGNNISELKKLNVEDAIPCSRQVITKYFDPNDVESVYAYIDSKFKAEELVSAFVKEKSDHIAIIMRLGWVNVMNNPHIEGNPCGDESCVWLSHRDAQNFISKCIEYVIKNQGQLLVLFAMSANKRCWLEMETAKKLLGYEPLDRAEDLLH
jgi:NAD+ dependent glucose-6-phosphate dehydrogenase